MKLGELQRYWDELGRTNAFWAVLTSAENWQVADFFATGRDEIRDLMQYVDSLAVRIPRSRALDFGCGVGRLSQALGEYFEEIYGVDIAPSMIELAVKCNRLGDRCRYVLNDGPDLRMFRDESFDLVYSNITLQHVAPEYTRGYLREFLRILSPSGLAVFQLPSHLGHHGRLKRLLMRRLPAAPIRAFRRVKGRASPRTRAHRNGTAEMEMWGIERDDVIRLLNRYGGRLVDARVDRRETANRSWVCYQYCVAKR